MFSLKSLFFLALLVAVVFWSVRGRQKAPKIEDFRVPSGCARLWPLNSDEALVSVGAGTELRVKLEDGKGVKIGGQTFGEGVHVLRINWGGPKGRFGFTSKGHTHTIPTNYTKQFEQLSCFLFPESREILATAVDSRGGKLASVILEVSKNK